MDLEAATLRVGVHTPTQHADIADLTRIWSRVDELGFDLLSVFDHLHPVDEPGRSIDAVAAHAVIAATTKSVQVGCLVCCVGYRHPASFARAASSIGYISGGRAVVGLGVWTGGGGERRTLPLAGLLTDGWNIPMATVEDFGRKNRIVTDAAIDAGRDPSRIERSVNLGLCFDESRLSERFGTRGKQLSPAILTGSDDVERFARDILPGIA